MFFRLYVLIQKITNTINVEGVYSYDNAINKKNELSMKNPFHNYYIEGPFKYQDISVDPFSFPKPNTPFGFPPIIEDPKPKPPFGFPPIIEDPKPNPPFLINSKDPNNMNEDED